MATAKAVASKHKTVKKKASAKKHVVPKQTSFGLAAEERPFFEFRITQQTFYWLVLGAVSIVFAIWIVTLDARIQKLYDEIDVTTLNQPIQPKQPAAAPSAATD